MSHAAVAQPPTNDPIRVLPASNVAVERVGLVRRLAADQLHQLVTAVPESMGQAPHTRAGDGPGRQP